MGEQEMLEFLSRVRVQLLRAELARTQEMLEMAICDAERIKMRGAMR